MSFDKEPLAMFLFGFLGLLSPTVTILVFLIRWLRNYSARWELIISITLICVCGVFIILILILLCKIGKELFYEIKIAIEIRKEEKGKEKELLS
ncbi:MAG TPA: hypothetical protein VMZ29_05880 [Candidatus Bathyarchaeia archaeon]|nr:hypothetical protein [Candidatus Bathyarchaeia archaeon]